MDNVLTFDPQKEIEDIVLFLQTSFSKAQKRNGVIGVSGGIDSAVSLMLLTKAIGKKHVYPALLPYGDLGEENTQDARILIQKLGIQKSNLQEIDCRPIVDIILPKTHVNTNIRRGNIIARVRMMLLYDLAKARGALVVGTENKSEHILGYFTKHGDEASDIEPIIDLYKTQIYRLAKSLELPGSIIKKAPAAGLWQGQTDEKELGFTYANADPVLYYLYDKKSSVEEIEKKGFEKNLVEKVKAQVDKNAFKHTSPIRRSSINMV